MKVIVYIQAEDLVKIHIVPVLAPLVSVNSYELFLVDLEGEGFDRNLI